MTIKKYIAPVLEAFAGLVSKVPLTEFSLFFVQGMANRMGVSFFKYGPVPEAYPDKVDAIATGKEKIKLYLEGGVVKGKAIEPGNVEYLIDAANYMMIEFMYPRNPNAFFKATDSDGSTGRTWVDGTQTDAGHGAKQRNEAVQSFYDKRGRNGD